MAQVAEICFLPGCLEITGKSFVSQPKSGFVPLLSCRCCTSAQPCLGFLTCRTVTPLYNNCLGHHRSGPPHIKVYLLQGAASLQQLHLPPKKVDTLSCRRSQGFSNKHYLTDKDKSGRLTTPEGLTLSNTKVCMTHQAFAVQMLCMML